jgi:hypothetical protein
MIGLIGQNFQSPGSQSHKYHPMQQANVPANLSCDNGDKPDFFFCLVPPV